jgi:hypothetical protein
MEMAGGGEDLIYDALYTDSDSDLGPLGAMISSPPSDKGDEDCSATIASSIILLGWDPTHGRTGGNIGCNAYGKRSRSR